MIWHMRPEWHIFHISLVGILVLLFYSLAAPICKILFLPLENITYVFAPLFKIPSIHCWQTAVNVGFDQEYNQRKPNNGKMIMCCDE